MLLEKGTLCIVKRGYKWYRARFGGKRDAFYGMDRISSLSETRGKKFVTLAAYLRLNKIKENEEKILKGFAVERLYIKFKKPVRVKKAKRVKAVNKETLNPGEKISDKKVEKHWWSASNEICLSCTKSCKQSGFVTIVQCKSYTKKAKEEANA